jgi:predicted chitinase
MLQLFLLRRHQKRLQLEDTSAIIVPSSSALQKTQTRNGKKQKRNKDGKCGCRCGKVQISGKRNKE